MKKILIIIGAIFILGVLLFQIGCDKETINSNKNIEKEIKLTKNADNNSINYNNTSIIKNYFTNSRGLVVIFKFKHHGQFGSSCDDGSACGNCVGVCFIITWKKKTKSLTNAEFASGFGEAEIEIINNKLHVIFGRSADNDSGYVTVSENYSIGSEVSMELGYSDVEVQLGSYEIDYSNYEYGEVFFEIETTD